MSTSDQKFIAQAPDLDLSDGSEMLTDFSQEAQRHLISARNALLVLDTMPADEEAVEKVFKTFHTIRGLSDFLDLRNICQLTNESEVLMDMVRKSQLDLDAGVIDLISQAIDNTQTLLELLDEQIANDGELETTYFDVSELYNDIREVTSKKERNSKVNKTLIKKLQTINCQPDLTVYDDLESQTATESGQVTVDSSVLKKLLSDYKDASKKLAETQSKLQERQRELFRERALAIRLTEKAQGEARSKSEYLASMSHEIRTLINAILGFTDLLKSGSLDEKQNDHLNTIILSGKMLLGIVNDILDFSKVEAGKLKLEYIDFNLPQVVEDVFKIVRTRLNSKPINLYFNIDRKVPKNLVGDPTRLKQIFINLLDNAIKFTDRGEIGLDIRLEGDREATIENKFKIRFVIQDTGIGIPEDRQNQIFESFTQAESSTTRLYGGTGLGLTLCKNFVEKMGGKLRVKSTLGKGSRFIFSILLEEGDFMINEEPRKLKSMGGTHLMIVEGHETSSPSWVSFCEVNGINVIFANSAKQASEALLKLQESKNPVPKIIFIDALLPDKEGFMLALKVKQQPDFDEIKLVAVTSDVKIDNTDDYREAKFDAWLGKPVIQSEVKELLVKLIEGKVFKERDFSKDVLGAISCEGIKILVVEDSMPNQELLRIHLESLGCSCEFASNGKEAIELLRENDYDICFMDLQMPVLNGIEATKAIRSELRNRLPIIALTAAEVEDEKDKCLESGMNDYLSKPFGIEELKRKIIKHSKM